MLYQVFKSKALLVFTVFLLMSTYSQAQFSKNKSAVTGQSFKLKRGKVAKRRQKPINYINSIDLSIGIGTSTYYGELCSGVSCGIKNMMPSIHIGAYYRYSEHFSARLEFGYLPLSGDDKYSDYADTRGLKFQNNGWEGTGVVIYDFVAFRKMYRQRSFVNPYIAIGLGLYRYEPFAEYNGIKYNLRNYRTEESKDYGKYTFTIPVGLGVRFSLTPFIELALEARYNKTFTDYLDDVSDKYPSTNADQIGKTESLLSDPAPGRDPNLVSHVGRGGIRGNPKTKDGYYNFEVKLIYTLKVTHQRYNINSNKSKFRMVNGVKKRH